MNGPRSIGPEYTGKHRRDSGPGVLPQAARNPPRPLSRRSSPVYSVPVLRGPSVPPRSSPPRSEHSPGRRACRPHPAHLAPGPAAPRERSALPPLPSPRVVAGCVQPDGFQAEASLAALNTSATHPNDSASRAPPRCSACADDRLRWCRA